MKKLRVAFGVMAIALLTGCVKEIAHVEEAAESTQLPLQSEEA